MLKNYAYWLIVLCVLNIESSFSNAATAENYLEDDINRFCKYMPSLYTVQEAAQHAKNIYRISRSVEDHVSHKSSTSPKDYEKKVTWEGNVYYTFYGQTGKSYKQALGAIVPKDDKTYIIFRGSFFYDDWITNTDADLIGWIPGFNGNVHKGLDEVVLSAWVSMEEHLERLAVLKNKNPIIIAGHSLGGGLACLCAAHLAQRHKRLSSDLNLITFCAMRPGDEVFSKGLERHLNTAFAFIRPHDIVPTLPYWGYVGGKKIYLREEGSPSSRISDPIREILYLVRDFKGEDALIGKIARAGVVMKHGNDLVQTLVQAHQVPTKEELSKAYKSFQSSYRKKYMSSPLHYLMNTIIEEVKEKIISIIKSRMIQDISHLKVEQFRLHINPQDAEPKVEYTIQLRNNEERYEGLTGSIKSKNEQTNSHLEIYKSFYENVLPSFIESQNWSLLKKKLELYQRTLMKADYLEEWLSYNKKSSQRDKK